MAQSSTIFAIERVPFTRYANKKQVIFENSFGKLRKTEKDILPVNSRSRGRGGGRLLVNFRQHRYCRVDANI